MSNRRAIALGLSVQILALCGLVGFSALRAAWAAHSSPSASFTQSGAPQCDSSEEESALNDVVIFGRCTSNEDCTSREFCGKPFGGCKRTGKCKARPEICPGIYKPVCGCNGKTYSNECESSRDGISIRADGPCPSAETPQGCASNKDCSAREFCEKPDGGCNQRGKCEARPEVCPEIYKPVCGCDGKTYANLCFASRAGISIKLDGSCRRR